MWCPSKVQVASSSSSSSPSAYSAVLHHDCGAVAIALMSVCNLVPATAIALALRLLSLVNHTRSYLLSRSDSQYCIEVFCLSLEIDCSCPGNSMLDLDVPSQSVAVEVDWGQEKLF